MKKRGVDVFFGTLERGIQDFWKRQWLIPR
jgi:hypothetical protein